MITGGDIDWTAVRRVLVVRLRSIGDTVLVTPTLRALRRALPEAKIDVLLEDWVAPVLDGFTDVDDVLSFRRSSKISRFGLAREVRKRRYDVVINLHGGTTSTFFTRVSGAPNRLGYAHYRYNFLYNHRLSSSADFWQRRVTHSAEQHLALVGAFGIPVEDRLKTRLKVTDSAAESIELRIEDLDSISKNQYSKINLHEEDISNPKSKIQNPKSPIKKSKLALLHPVAAFDTKEWSVGNFASICDYLGANGFQIIAVGAPHELGKIERLKALSNVPIRIFTDLTLPEITALAARADIFVGNDSGIAHIAGAVGCPSVVIFGSSNRDHWRPWTDAPHRIVFEPFECQPCAGYRCEKFDSPRCIESVTVDHVIGAIGQLFDADTNAEPRNAEPRTK